MCINVQGTFIRQRQRHRTSLPHSSHHFSPQLTHPPWYGADAAEFTFFRCLSLGGFLLVRTHTTCTYCSFTSSVCICTCIICIHVCMHVCLSVCVYAKCAALELCVSPSASLPLASIVICTIQQQYFKDIELLREAERM